MWTAADTWFMIILVAYFILAVVLDNASTLVKKSLFIIGLLCCVALYALFVPSSTFGMFFTNSIASQVKLDSDNKYADGDCIFTQQIGYDKDIEDTDTDDKQNMPELIGDLLTKRITSIASATVDTQKEYTMQFADSYLVLTPTESRVDLEIIKGELPEDT